MRNLLYVPIIHTEADLGSSGPALEIKSASLYGEKRWAEHKEIVSRFWQRVSDYLLSLNSKGLKIYQDGLAADGQPGLRIVEEVARRGSQNYRIIQELISRGAEIRQTEDVSLLRAEQEFLAQIVQGKLGPEQTPDYASYGQQKRRLTEERDRFIAQQINQTLQEGETAVLFIGAYHKVLSHLARDIVVLQVKEQERVEAYFQELASRRDSERLKQLADYLASPLKEYSSNQ